MGFDDDAPRGLTNGDRRRLATVETVREAGSRLFTVRDGYDDPEEVTLVPCEDGVEHGSTNGQRGSRGDDGVEDGTTNRRPSADAGVEAGVNRCTRELQRLDAGDGVAIRAVPLGDSKP